MHDVVFKTHQFPQEVMRGTVSTRCRANGMSWVTVQKIIALVAARMLRPGLYKVNSLGVRGRIATAAAGLDRRREVHRSLGQSAVSLYNGSNRNGMKLISK